MLLIIAATDALDEIRGASGAARRQLRARLHPDGGVWAAARGREGERVLLRLAERYGTRVWGESGWMVRKPQLRLPGF